MTPAELLRFYDVEERTRVDATAPGFLIEWDGPILRMIGPGPEAASNGVLFARLDDANADDAIARQIALFGRDGHAFEWKHFSHDEPADLPGRLQAAGLEAQEPESFVALDLSRELPQTRSKDIEVLRLDDPASFGVIAAVNRAVYGDDDHAAWLERVITDEKRSDPDSLSLYAAFAGEAPVSVGWMRHRRGGLFGSLWGGSTLAEYRGRGIYSSLVAARAREARERGCRWLTVDCSPMSLPILQRRGFEKLAVITPFIWSS
jgi:GNAT superfamily N-acetyltransferase